MAANAAGYVSLAEIGQQPASRQPERRTAEIVQLVPHGHPLKLRVTPLQESSDAPEAKPPDPEVA